MGAVAVAGLCEEAGRAAFPSPLLPTINTTYLLAACDSAAANLALEAIVGGASASPVLTNGAGSWEEPDSDVRFASGKLKGSASFVQDAQKVGHFLVQSGVDTVPAPMAAGTMPKVGSLLCARR